MEVTYIVNGKSLTKEEYDKVKGPSRLAEMLKSGQPPKANTDREFLAGHCNGNQFEGNQAMGDYYRSVAESKGQDVTGKVYMSSLAKFPGDPEAWVSGKGDVERVLDKNGWGCEGSVNRPVTNIAPPKETAVAPEVLQESVLDAIQEAGGDEVNIHDVAEEAFEKRKASWVKEKYEPSMLVGDDSDGE